MTKYGGETAHMFTEATISDVNSWLSSENHILFEKYTPSVYNIKEIDLFNQKALLRLRTQIV